MHEHKASSLDMSVEEDPSFSVDDSSLDQSRSSIPPPPDRGVATEVLLVPAPDALEDDLPGIGTRRTSMRIAPDALKYWDAKALEVVKAAELQDWGAVQATADEAAAFLRQQVGSFVQFVHTSRRGSPPGEV